MKKMIDKKVEDEIKNLFLNKKYEEVIQFSKNIQYHIKDHLVCLI